MLNQSLVQKLIWSSWGRPHSEASDCVAWASNQAVRIRNLPCHRVVQRRWEAAIGTEVWRRAVAMLRSCMPQPDAVTSLIAEGEV